MPQPQATLPPPVGTPPWFYTYYQQMLYQQQILQVLLGQAAGKEETFGAAGTGFATAPTGSATVITLGRVAVLTLPTLSAVSNAGTFTVSGLPASLQPSMTSRHVVRIADNGGDELGVVRLNEGTVVIDVLRSSGAVFTSSGNKVLYGTTLVYLLP